MAHTRRRLSYLFLCTVPALASIVAAVRPLRVQGVYQTIGVLLFAAIVISAWILGAQAEQKLAVAGVLLMAPFALIALLWVGLGPPWVTTPAENVMRYLVLLVSSLAVTGGFVVLKDALSEAGERYYSTLGLPATVLAGAAYLTWTSFVLGAYVVKARAGRAPAAIAALSDVLDIQLDAACILTYLATAAFAASFGRLRWL